MSFEHHLPVRPLLMPLHSHTWPLCFSDFNQCSHWLQPWAPPGLYGRKKKTAGCCHMYDIMMCGLSWIQICEVWTKGECSCLSVVLNMSALWVDLFVWGSGTIGAICMMWWSLHKASPVTMFTQAVRNVVQKHLYADTLLNDITGFIRSDWEECDIRTFAAVQFMINGCCSCYLTHILILAFKSTWTRTLPPKCSPSAPSAGTRANGDEIVL